MNDERVHVTPDVPVNWDAPSAVVAPTRCISCGRLPTETCCDICHRVARAVARLAYAIGYDETGDEMTELLGEVNAEEVNQ